MFEGGFFVYFWEGLGDLVFWFLGFFVCLRYFCLEERGVEVVLGGIL